MKQSVYVYTKVNLFMYRYRHLIAQTNVRIYVSSHIIRKQKSKCNNKFMYMYKDQYRYVDIHRMYTYILRTCDIPIYLYVYMCSY